MNREDFLRELEEALAGDVPEAVIRDNLSYYGSYLSQEMAKGRSVDDIVAEIGEPFIIAKTIIDSTEAADDPAGNDGYGSYRETYTDSRSGQYQNTDQGYGDQQGPHMHYIDLNKWYWKLLAIIILFMVVSLVFNIVGGILALLIRFAGPLMMIFLVVWVIRNFKK